MTKSFRPAHKGSFRPISKQYARAVALARKAPLAAPAIRKLERDRDGAQAKADMAHKQAAGFARQGDTQEAALQTATAETHEAQVLALNEQIAKLREGA